jgi:hypothetical protein
LCLTTAIKNDGRKFVMMYCATTLAETSVIDPQFSIVSDFELIKFNVVAVADIV